MTGEDTNLKKLTCALLICALCVCVLTGCGKKAAESDDGGSSAAEIASEVTPVPAEGSHGEEDQSKALEDMPTLAPVETVEGGAADLGELSGEDEAIPSDDSEDYFSVDALIDRTQPQEFETYDESEHPQPDAGIQVIDPSTVQFTALTDESVGLNFYYPADWVNIPGVFTICFREVVEPGDFPARVAITGKKLVHSPEGTVITDELTSFVRTIYKQYDPNTFQLGTSNSQDTFLGKQAYSNTYLAYSGETEVKGFIIGTSVGKRLYVFHFCASYEDYTAMEKVMRYMVKSVQLPKSED